MYFHLLFIFFSTETIVEACIEKYVVKHKSAKLFMMYAVIKLRVSQLELVSQSQIDRVSQLELVSQSQLLRVRVSQLSQLSQLDLELVKLTDRQTDNIRIYRYASQTIMKEEGKCLLLQQQLAKDRYQRPVEAIAYPCLATILYTLLSLYPLDNCVIQSIFILRTYYSYYTYYVIHKQFT